MFSERNLHIEWKSQLDFNRITTVSHFLLYRTSSILSMVSNDYKLLASIKKRTVSGRTLHYSLMGNSIHTVSIREYTRKGKERTMAKMTRRAMLWATSAGVAAVAGVSALAGKQLTSASAAGATSSEVATGSSATIYIANVNGDTLSILSGENEIVVHNAALVKQLISSR